MLKLLSPEEKQAQVADAISRIDKGEVITVSSSSGSAISICIGDFRKIGWSERCTDRRGMWYDWNGPVAIIVDDELVEPGNSTEYCEMDWS